MHAYLVNSAFKICIKPHIYWGEIIFDSSLCTCFEVRENSCKIRMAL